MCDVHNHTITQSYNQFELLKYFCQTTYTHSLLTFSFVLLAAKETKKQGRMSDRSRRRNVPEDIQGSEPQGGRDALIALFASGQKPSRLRIYFAHAL